MDLRFISVIAGNSPLLKDYQVIPKAVMRKQSQVIISDTSRKPSDKTYGVLEGGDPGTLGLQNLCCRWQVPGWLDVCSAEEGTGGIVQVLQVEVLYHWWFWVFSALVGNGEGYLESFLLLLSLALLEESVQLHLPFLCLVSRQEVTLHVLDHVFDFIQILELHRLGSLFYCLGRLLGRLLSLFGLSRAGPSLLDTLDELLGAVQGLLDLA